MKTMRRCLCLLLALLFCCAAALAEDEDYSLGEDDDSDLFIEVTYGDVPWNFPIDLSDLEPRFLVLANKHMKLSRSFVPEPLVTVKARKSNKDGSNANHGVYKASGSKMQLQEDCYEALVAMSEAALEDGITLYLKSAYRSWKTQNTMYNNRLQKNHGRDDGWVTVAGGSDHQTGLGCDIVNRAWRDKAMNEKFASTEAAQWMLEHCAEFGFILRYPEDKTDITEINFEPWHFRYVGVPVATYIMDNGLCLEEFHEELSDAIEAFIAAGGDPALVQPLIQVSAE